MAFRKKARYILAESPDLLIIQECEHPDKLVFDAAFPKPYDSIWFGENKNKGIGIFCYAKFKLKVHNDYNPEFKYIVPVFVGGTRSSFTLFAIWANNPADPDGQYVTQVWKAINYYTALLNKRKVLLIGDFNSNAIWDRPRRVGNHSDLVTLLGTKGISSLYHQHFSVEHGKEPHPTLYMYRHENKPYHIDYCFASRLLAKHLMHLKVGSFRKWKQYSDHVPLIATFQRIVFE